MSSSSSSSSVDSLLADFHSSISGIASLSLIPQSRPFYFLSASSSLSDAIQLLSARRILSAPVFDTSRDMCLGACDLLTIAKFLAKENAKRAKSSLQGHAHATHDSKGDPSLEAAKNFLATETKSLGAVKLEEVMQSENLRTSLASFYEENPLSDLIDYFNTRSVHRVALISKSCELTHPCSQSDVIVWLCQQFDEEKFSNLGALTIDKLTEHLSEAKSSSSSLAHSKPICVSESTSVVAALDSLIRHNISCVGVVNGSGQLVANFSPSDLRGLSDFQYLSYSVMEYLKKFSPSSISPLVLTSSTSLSAFLHSLQSKHIHRGWLVDSSLVPLRVLTLSDLMRFLSSGNRITEEAANAGKDVSKLWTAKMLDAGKTVDSSHLFQKSLNIGGSNTDGKMDTGK